MKQVRLLPLYRKERMFPEHWTVEEVLRFGLAEILVNQEKQMSALTDLQAAVTKLQTDVNAFIAANSGGASDADLQALTTQINAIDAVINPPATPAA